MKRLLWCGGSHLAHARGHILQRWPDAENDFYVTAGPDNNRWSAGGGRYPVQGTWVGPNAYQPDRSIDLSHYDAIVFIGQWIQPHKVFRAGQPLSADLLHCIVADGSILLHPPDGAFNEPLTLFPALAPGRCWLLCDPYPHAESHWEAQHCHGHYRDIPTAYIEAYIEGLKRFCAERTIQLLLQPDSSHHNRITLSQYSRGDRIHMNDAFWRLNLDQLTAMYKVTPSSLRTESQ